MSVADPIHVLLVEADPGYAAGLERSLEALKPSVRLDAGFDVHVVGALEPALDVLRDGGIDVVLLDSTLPDADWLAAVEAVVPGCASAPVVVLTDAHNEEQASAIFRAGAQDYLYKGDATPPLVARSLCYAIERQRAQRDCERRMAEHAESLARSNAELQEFAFIASHDLQEPLRKVRAFGGRLRHRFAEQLPPEGIDCIERMERSAQRMQVLIHDLLAFSRVATKGQPFRPVDLAEIAREVIADLEVRIEELGAQVEIGELPAIEADPTQMRQLLQNLIGNALKFHREGEAPRVAVRAVIGDDGACEVEIADNGIGFDEKHLERIFGVFQRLHGRSAYEGTGIGLAICRKIALRHGGDVTATSTPGVGSVFRLRVPVGRGGEAE